MASLLVITYVIINGFSSRRNLLCIIVGQILQWQGRDRDALD